MNGTDIFFFFFVTDAQDAFRRVPSGSPQKNRSSGLVAMACMPREERFAEFRSIRPIRVQSVGVVPMTAARAKPGHPAQLARSLASLGMTTRRTARQLSVELISAARGVQYGQADTLQEGTKLKLIGLAVVTLSALVGPMSAQTPVSTPAHIILIRHAEKPADSENPHLSKAGVKRAQALVSFITRDPQMTSLGRPVAVFATQTTKDDNGQRTQETVAPLATALRTIGSNAVPWKGLCGLGEADSLHGGVRRQNRRRLLEP